MLYFYFEPHVCVCVCVCVFIFFHREGLCQVPSSPYLKMSYFTSKVEPHVIRMSLQCHPYVTLMYSYVLACHPYVTRITLSSVSHSYVPVCHSYVLVCYPYVTRMYSYVIRMSLVCGFTMNRISVLNL